MASGAEPVFGPASELPPGPRSALVIATSTYADTQLRQLRSPVKDAEGLAAVLADPAIGGFKVTSLVDQTEWRIRREIAAFLTNRTADETVLVYLSCHGIQDARGRLLFAATDTETKYPHASAVRAAELLDELDECKARRQILILDCCFSGSFSDSKGDLNLEAKLRGHSRGREVLTASRGFEYSFEGEPLDDAITGSVFTTGLVEGLRTGAADTDKNGHITVEEAYAYTFHYVQAAGKPQTPQRWLSHGEGQKIVLARSVSGREVSPARLPEDLAHNLESRFPDVRIGAVNAIAAWLTDPDPARRLAALRALEDVVENDVRRVSEAARSHVDTTSLSEVHAEPASVMSAGPLPRKGAVTATAVRYRLIARKGRRPVSPPGAMGARWVPRRAVAALEGYAGTVRGVAFSPDGELIAAAGSDGKVGLWNGTNRKPLPSLTGHIGQVTGLAFSQTQPLLVSASSDRTVRLWQ